MTPDEKAGQVLVVDFTGLTVTPHALKVVEKFNCAGLRVQSNVRYKNRYKVESGMEELVKHRYVREPAGGCKDYAFNAPAPSCTAGQYASVLNRLKELAMNRRVPVPLHVVLDQEGGGSINFNCGDVRLFPHQMGLAATGDPDLARRACKILARQLKSAGVDWIHSPVVDVNTEPRNPEIGIRAFSDDAGTVEVYSLAMLAAFREEKLIATGKHFPGRGESLMDAHKALPVIDVSAARIREVHLAPYRALIEAGLPSVMIAHTIYPHLTGDHTLATVSGKIITGLLRGELGFSGAITSDNLLMTGLIREYEIIDACKLALLAGMTLLLLRDEGPLVDEIYHGLVTAIRSGEIPQHVIDDAICRNLAVKLEYGMFENGGLADPKVADAVQGDPEAIAVERETARKSVVLSSPSGRIPSFPTEAKILLVEQVGAAQFTVNNFRCHPGNLWEAMLAHSRNVYCVEIDGWNAAGPEEAERVFRRLGEADVIVATNYQTTRASKPNHAFIRKIRERIGDKPLIVLTNAPYQPDGDIATELCLFADNPESLRAAADVIYGKLEPSGALPLVAPPPP